MDKLFLYIIYFIFSQQPSFFYSEKQQISGNARKHSA